MENVQIVEKVEPRGEVTGQPRTRRLSRALRDLIPTTVVAALVAAAVSVVVAGSTRELHAPFAGPAGDAPGLTRMPATQPGEESVSVWLAPKATKPRSSGPGFDLELLAPLLNADQPPVGARGLIFGPSRRAVADLAGTARTVALPVPGSMPIEAETVLPAPPAPAADVSPPATSPEAVAVPVPATQEAQGLQRPRKLKGTKAAPAVSGSSVRIASAKSRPHRPKTTSGPAAAEDPQAQPRGKGNGKDQATAAGHDDAAGDDQAATRGHDKGQAKGHDKGQAKGHTAGHPRPPKADKQG